jgi:hypothetical protein
MAYGARKAAFPKQERMRDRMLLYAIGISLALSAADARAAGVSSGGVMNQAATDQNSDHGIHDLGLLPPAGNAGGPTPAPSTAPAVSSAEPVPELPTWAMMLLCLAGLGLAGFKKGRKDRLSPGIE